MFCIHGSTAEADESHSGIFGYINYLVEKDRKFILDTLVNGEFSIVLLPLSGLEELL